MFITNVSPEQFAKVAERLYNAVGEKMFNIVENTRYTRSNFDLLFYNPVFFEALLKFFDVKKRRRELTLQEVIEKNNVELLALCAKYGWLKTPRIRDMMIAYSQEKNKTECTAFLLDYKMKNFDLEAERRRAERKMERELNADPNSVSELRKSWSFKKREDGGLIITNYKGKRTEIIVPEKIGEDIVVEIGDDAFSTSACRLTPEMKEVRRAITKITLPETVRAIGKGAFWACESLASVNIPEGVGVIKRNTFLLCDNLERIVIPRSVKSIDFQEFYGCKNLTLIVERGSYAEDYCKRIHIAFEYKE